VGYGSGSHVIRNAEITGAIKIKVRVIPTSHEIIFSNKYVDITFAEDCTKTDDSGKIKTVKGKDLEFQVSLKAEYADSYQINRVEYRIGTDGSPGGVYTVDNINYSIPEGNITDRVEIIVDASEIKYEVLFTIDSATVKGVPKAVTYRNDQRVLFKKGETLSFKVTPNSGKVVRYVSISEIPENREVIPDENGVYNVVIDKDMHIMIYAGQKAETTVFWTGPKMQIQGVGFKPVTEDKEHYNYGIIEGNKIQFKVVGDIGFRALSVTIDGTETVLEPDSQGRYTLVGTQQDQYITIEMEQFAPTEDRAIQVANRAEKVTYKVDTAKGSGVTQNKGKENRYTLAAGTEFLKYTVTVPAHYGATVIADGFALNENVEVQLAGETKAYDIQPAAETKTYEFRIINKNPRRLAGTLGRDNSR